MGGGSARRRGSQRGGACPLTGVVTVVSRRRTCTGKRPPNASRTKSSCGEAVGPYTPYISLVEMLKRKRSVLVVMLGMCFAPPLPIPMRDLRDGQAWSIAVQEPQEAAGYLRREKKECRQQSSPREHFSLRS